MAISPCLSHLEGGVWALSGELDMASVPRVLEQGANLLRGGTKPVVDLRGVERIDSAGLALLIEWMREARRSGRAIRFQNIPARMLPIARVCGLEAILPANYFADETAGSGVGESGSEATDDC